MSERNLLPQPARRCDSATFQIPKPTVPVSSISGLQEPCDHKHHQRVFDGEDTELDCRRTAQHCSKSTLSKDPARTTETSLTRLTATMSDAKIPHRPTTMESHGDLAAVPQIMGVSAPARGLERSTTTKRFCRAIKSKPSTGPHFLGDIKPDSENTPFASIRSMGPIIPVMDENIQANHNNTSETNIVLSQERATGNVFVETGSEYSFPGSKVHHDRDFFLQGLDLVGQTEEPKSVAITTSRSWPEMLCGAEQGTTSWPHINKHGLGLSPEIGNDPSIFDFNGLHDQQYAFIPSWKAASKVPSTTVLQGNLQHSSQGAFYKPQGVTVPDIFVEDIDHRGVQKNHREPELDQLELGSKGAASLASLQDFRSRKRLREELEDEDYESDDTIGKKRDSQLHDAETRPGQKYLACPYFKRDRVKHLNCFRRFQLKRVKDVKQHLYRKHPQPSFYCPRCWVTFSTAGQRDDHFTAEKTCSKRKAPIFEGVSGDQKSQLAQRPASGGSGEENQWFKVWDILFPGEPQPESPYLGNELEEVVLTVRGFWTKSKSRIVSNVLSKASVQIPQLKTEGCSEDNEKEVARIMDTLLEELESISKAKTVNVSENEAQAGESEPGSKSRESSPVPLLLSSGRTSRSLSSVSNGSAIPLNLQLPTTIVSEDIGRIPALPGQSLPMVQPDQQPQDWEKQNERAQETFPNYFLSCVDEETNLLGPDYFDIQ